MDNYNGFLLVHQFVLNQCEVIPAYIKINEINYISTQSIGGRILTKMMLNCGHYVYATEDIREIMEEMK